MKSFRRTNSKEIKLAFERHQNSIKFEVHHAYNKPSDNKYMAFEECKIIMRNYNGFDLRIISYNSFTFTVGFFGYISDELNFFYITADKIRYTSIENLI